MSSLASEPLTLERLQTLTKPTARYALYPPDIAWSVLRSGMVEEAWEILKGSDNPEEHIGEIGDGFYYVSEISRYGDADRSEVPQGRPDLATFQRDNPGNRIPIYELSGKELTLAADSRAVLGMTVLRLVDVLNPKTAELWHGITDRPTLGVALGDVAAALAHHATELDIDIVDAITRTLEKLAARQRLPHVVAQAEQAAQRKLSSGRERLQIVPWIHKLAIKAAYAQWDVQASKRYWLSK